MKQIGFALLFVALASSAAAQAGGGLQYDDYRRAFEHNQSDNEQQRLDAANWHLYVHGYVEGLGYGLMLSSGLLALQHREPVVCVPKGLTLGFDNFKSMIDSQMEEWSKAYPPPPKDMKIETALGAAFLKAFPCTPTPSPKK